MLERSPASDRDQLLFKRILRGSCGGRTASGSLKLGQVYVLSECTRTSVCFFLLPSFMAPLNDELGGALAIEEECLECVCFPDVCTYVSFCGLRCVTVAI